jgi:hypothetical protein
MASHLDFQQFPVLLKSIHPLQGAQGTKNAVTNTKTSTRRDSWKGKRDTLCCPNPQKQQRATLRRPQRK